MKPGYSAYFIPASRGDLSGDFPRPVDMVHAIDPDTLHRAKLTVADFAPDPAERRMFLEMLGFLPYATNRLGIGHK